MLSGNSVEESSVAVQWEISFAHTDIASMTNGECYNGILFLEIHIRSHDS